MTWKKFETAILPGIFVAWCAARAWWFFSARHLHGAGETVYLAFPALHIADICLAGAMVLLGILWLVFRKKIRIPLSGMMAAEILHGLARFIITGFTPLNFPALIRLAAYIFCMISTYYMGGDVHARRKDIVCGGSLLQGGSGSAGDGETPEGQAGNADAGGEDIAG